MESGIETRSFKAKAEHAPIEGGGIVAEGLLVVRVDEPSADGCVDGKVREVLAVEIGEDDLGVAGVCGDHLLGFV